MKVSLISTVKDASAHIEEFVGSVRAQTRAPDEMIVVDGGSTDGTPELLRRAAADAVTVIEERGANIARGRNLAIAAAAHDVIAVTDADCVLDPRWLERILEPIEADADVSMGFYLPITDGFLQDVHRVGEPPARRVGGRPRALHAERAIRRVPTRLDRGGRRLSGVARDRRGHVGEPPLARARSGHAVRARRRGSLALAPDAASDVGAVLPVRARRRAGRDVPRTPRAAVRGVRRRCHGARLAQAMAEGHWPPPVPSRTRANRYAGHGAACRSSTSARPPRSSSPR